MVTERAFAPEGGFWRVGGKVDSIFALSAFDPETAFDAGLRALEHPDSRVRERYPYLLVGFDPGHAVPALFETVCLEKSRVVQAAIARALAEAPAQALPLLLAQLEDTDPGRRRVACRLAASQEPTDELCRAIRARLHDNRAEVSEAAENALWELQKAAWCRELVQAFSAETQIPRRWRLLDAALATGDPGDEHRPWPAWLTESCADLPYLWREYISEALKERRKEVLKAAQDADRRND
jgi:hypothetical protein